MSWPVANPVPFCSTMLVEDGGDDGFSPGFSAKKVKAVQRPPKTTAPPPRNSEFRVTLVSQERQNPRPHESPNILDNYE